jgi:BMFP domain-containing protein YqiC
MNPQTGSKPNVEFASTRRPISRRRFLRGAAVAVALPLLDSMQAQFARATADQAPRRMFGICNNLGVLPEPFFPRDAGRDYMPSPYLRLLQEHRADFTVLSGVSHPMVDGGHPSDICFLTAAAHPGSSSFRNSISLDQFVAERIGTLTRFPSLTLAVNGGRGLSWTRTGVMIPPEGQASRVFNQLFLQDSPAEIEAQIREIDTGRSILDVVAGQAKDLQRQVGARDRNRLDQYFTSVRDLEHRLQESRGWANRPKPRVNVSAPTDPTSPAQYMAKVQVMYDLARLAFETDSTRAITLMLNSVGTPAVQIDGATITDSYHNLSHHGQAEEKLSQLKVIDEWQMKLLADLFKSLKSVREDGATLLDRTMVIYGSNLGDANAHSTTNLPVLFAGGGFRHSQHLAFERSRNYPLPNLFVSMLQRMGIEQTSFGPSTGTMRGLEMAG